LKKNPLEWKTRTNPLVIRGEQKRKLSKRIRKKKVAAFGKEGKCRGPQNHATTKKKKKRRNRKRAKNIVTYLSKNNKNRHGNKSHREKQNRNALCPAKKWGGGKKTKKKGCSEKTMVGIIQID